MRGEVNARILATRECLERAVLVVAMTRAMVVPARRQQRGEAVKTQNSEATPGAQESISSGASGLYRL
jgi:hypothetical protein